MPLSRLSGRLPGPGQYTNRAQMSRQITLLSPSPRGGDGSGGAPSPAFVSWASIRSLAGDELDKAQQIAQDISHLVVVPYQPGIQGNWQVQFENRIFQIKAIEDPDEMHWELRIYCAEIGQSAGQQA